MRACAVETHVKISQQPLHREIYKKNAAAQTRAADLMRACAVETHVKISQEPLYASKMPQAKTAQQTLCDPASNRMSRFHKSHFIRKFTGQMPRPKTPPQTCARSRIACQDLTRTTLYGNLQEKCRVPNCAVDFVRACAVETHVSISQEPLYAEIYR